MSLNESPTTKQTTKPSAKDLKNMVYVPNASNPIPENNDVNLAMPLVYKPILLTEPAKTKK
jgi:hypothetical protein